MYTEYFGLKESPFSITLNPRFLYMSPQHGEAFAHLLYGIQNEGGFVLLTGEVGAGKSTVCRCLLEHTPPDTEIAFILNSKLTVLELLATICDEFKLDYPKNNTSVKTFVDAINEHLLRVYAEGRKAVLIIDEAQNLGREELEQVRLLTNLETNKRKLLQIIMLGQPELRDTLARPDLRQLAQRITARFHLGPLSRADVPPYVIHRLAVAGTNAELFPPTCFNALYRLSEGIPRLINIICDRALLGAYARGLKQVDEIILARAAREVFGEERRESPPKMRRPLRIGVALVALLLCGVGALAANHFWLRSPSLPETGLATRNEVPSPSLADTPSSSSALQLASATPVETVPTKTTDPPLPEEQVTLDWTAIPPSSASKTTSFTTLFSLWGANYETALGDACAYALRVGLRCFEHQGSLAELGDLNRPALLKLQSEKEGIYFAVLTGLEQGRAFLILGAETKQVGLATLGSLWSGNFILLWRPPPGYQDSIRPGRRGPEVQWLAEQLALFNKQPLPNPPVEEYGDLLARQVKAFQFSHGLIPDGIAGVQTIIRLDAAAGNAGPMLAGTALVR